MKKLSMLLTVTVICSALASCTDITKPPTDLDTDTTDISDEESTSAPDPFLDFPYNSEEGKTVREQQEEIKAAMERAINTEVVYKEIEEYHPDSSKKHDHIKAITYDGFEYNGQKTKVFAFIGFPDGASAQNPVPAVVLIHGGEGHPYYDWVRIWNDRGYAAIAMETTGYFPIARNDGFDEYQNARFVYELHGVFAEEGYTLAPDRFYPTEYMEIEEQWAYHGLTQVILAHNILRQDERVDNDKIGITGISWGGVMTSQVIGYDTRFAFAIPVYGTAYLGDETRPFDKFANEYVNALWGPERMLNNAKMPIMWYTYNDDSHFAVPAYVKSYLHTAEFNENNALVMRGGWGHSHTHVYKNNAQNVTFADWVVRGEGGFVTFKTQPSGREISCELNIPEGARKRVSASLYYITEPMTYSGDAGALGSMQLDQDWIVDEACLTVDVENGTVSGTIPEEAMGYYIQISFGVGSANCLSSSIYVAVE